MIDVSVNRADGSCMVDVNTSDWLTSVPLLVLKQNSQTWDSWLLTKSGLMSDSQHLSQRILG